MAEEMIATIRKNATDEIRVSLSQYNGHDLLNMRVWFEADDGSMRPGKAGMAFKVDKLQAFADGVDQALRRAKEKGLIA